MSADDDRPTTRCCCRQCGAMYDEYTDRLRPRQQRDLAKGCDPWGVCPACREDYRQKQDFARMRGKQKGADQ